MPNVNAFGMAKWPNTKKFIPGRGSKVANPQSFLMFWLFALVMKVNAENEATSRVKARSVQR